MQIWSLVRELGPARWVEKKKILTRNFLFWWCLCLVLAPVWRWLHRMPLGVFPPLQSSGGVWEGLVRFLFMFGRIPQWSHLVLGFCFQGVFCFFLILLITDSILFLVIGLFKWSVSSWFSFGGLETCPFLLGCPVCWHVTVHSILLVLLFCILVVLVVISLP